MPALEVHGVDKRFGAVHAVRSASLAFERGRIHAVVGENGAGKSTLLRIAAGLLVPDEGEAPSSRQSARPSHAGRSALARCGHGAAALRVGRCADRARERRARAGAAREVRVASTWVRHGQRPRAWRGRLARRSPGTRASRRWALASASGSRSRGRCYRDARVVILDEPTAVLTPGEASSLYATLRRLADAGRAVVVVTHKLDEVRDFADVATVMRRGAIVETREVTRSGDEVRSLARAIMGNESVAPLERGARKVGGGEPVLVLRDVRMGRAVRGVEPGGARRRDRRHRGRGGERSARDRSRARPARCHRQREHLPRGRCDRHRPRGSPPGGSGSRRTDPRQLCCSASWLASRGTASSTLTRWTAKRAPARRVRRGPTT